MAQESSYVPDAIPTEPAVDNVAYASATTPSSSAAGNVSAETSRTQFSKSFSDYSQEAKTKASTIGMLVSKLSDQVHGLIQGEIDLAKAKGKAMVSKLGAGVALLAVAGILALYMLGFALSAACQAFALIMPEWAATLVVVAILLVIIAILAAIGVVLLKKGSQDKPEPQTGMKKNIDALKKGMGK